jgi:hypothetical protein
MPAGNATTSTDDRRDDVTIRIEIDGIEVSLTGSRKGDGVFEALKGTAWKWSRPTGGFMLPRNLLPHTRERNVKAAKAKLTAAGFEVEVEDTGVRLSVAEEREQSVERLERRADRYEARAERRGADADGRYAAEHALLDPIPFGQPNIGGRLTSVYNRAEQHRVAARKASEEAEHAASRAEGIRRALQGTPLSTLRRRIERYETEIRDFDRRLEGKSVASGYGRPATGGYRERLLEAKARVQEALDLDRAELARRAEEEGVRVWTAADFKKGDRVLGRYGWEEVTRVNPKKLTVAAQPGWYNKIDYADVRGRCRDGEITK